MARTSLDWWAEVLTKPGKLEDWLKRQYHGEASSVPRLANLLKQAENILPAAECEDWQFLLTIISSDEQKHAAQVGKLMIARGLVPALLQGYKARYFQQFSEAKNIYDLAAMGAYAELISLTRFQAILAHPDTPSDIRQEFTSILFEEEFHYAAFRRLAGPAAMERAAISHQQGLNAVGIQGV